MSLLYTILLVLKSLFPFLREVVFRDKGVKEFLLSNKTATGLAACLLVMFLLFYYVKVVAEMTHAKNVELQGQVTELQGTIDEQKLWIGTLEGRLKDKKPRTQPTPPPTPAPPTPTIPERQPATAPPKSKHPPKQSLKDYAIGRLKAID